MTLEVLRKFFLWCLVFDVGLLLWWFLFLTFAHDWVYRMHTKWFKVSAEQFDAIHYAGMAFFKILIFVFNVTPFLALLIVG